MRRAHHCPRCGEICSDEHKLCAECQRGESDSTWATIAMLLCVAALLALAFLAPGGA